MLIGSPPSAWGRPDRQGLSVDLLGCDTMVDVQVVGGGRMGEALVGGWLASGRAPASIRIVEVHPDRRVELAQRYSGCDVSERIGAASGTVVAVKPGDVPAVVAQVGAAGGGRVLSIAAGVTLHQLETAAGPGVPVIRAMPNTPALVRCAMTAIVAGAAAAPADLEWARELLSAVGEVVEVAESQIDAVTAVSGSGPAYVFLVAEAMIDAGVLAGLPRDLATQLTNQTLLGAAQLLGSDGTAADHRAAVTSPGGTTAAGLRALEARAVRSAFLDAVMAAKARSVEMSS